MRKLRLRKFDSKRWGWMLWAPLAIVFIITLLQRTVGEAEWFTYVSLAFPPVLWTALLVVLGAICLFKHRILALAYGLAAIASIFLLWNPVFGRSHPKAKATLRVMTFNVEKFRAFTPEQVAAAIRSANPDVVCLQEAAPLAEPREIPQAFHRALPGYRVMQRGETAIVSKLPVVFGAAFALRGGEGGRPAQLATVMVGGRPISIVCVHLQFFPWDNLSQVSESKKHLLKEIDSLEDLIQGPGIPTVVAGDFNSQPQSRVHRMMRKHLLDAFQATNQGFGWTVPANFPLRRLDYIYTGLGLKPVRCWVQSKVASDHRAVVADLVME